MSGMGYLTKPLSALCPREHTTDVPELIHYHLRTKSYLKKLQDELHLKGDRVATPHLLEVKLCTVCTMER